MPSIKTRLDYQLSQAGASSPSSYAPTFAPYSIGDGTKFWRGDGTWAVPTGGGGTLGATEVDFGATPTDGTTLSLAVPGITAAALVDAKIYPMDTTTDNDANAHLVAASALKVSAIASTDLIDFDVHSLFGLATGKFKVRYSYA